jgi:hypothetical protein
MPSFSFFQYHQGVRIVCFSVLRFFIRRCPYSKDTDLEDDCNLMRMILPLLLLILHKKGRIADIHPVGDEIA